MKLGVLVRDIWAAIWHRPVTRQYPLEHEAPPPKLRAHLVWHPEQCSGCCLCMKDCPANALELITIDKANKQFVMRYHSDRCVYCGQCVANCRFNCLEMSNEQWEKAATTKESFIVDYGTDENLAILANRPDGDLADKT